MNLIKLPMFNKNNKLLNMGNFICTECCKRYKSASSLNIHIAKKHKHLTLDWKSCQYCESKFITQRALDTHLEKKHSLEIANIKENILLEAKGYRLIRVWEDDIINNIEEIKTLILNEINISNNTI